MHAHGDPAVRDAHAARALAHPLRARVLHELASAPASPRQVATTLGVPLTTVSYHFRFLAELGYLELLRTTPRRGAIEHCYRATARITVNVEALQREEPPDAT